MRSVVPAGSSESGNATFWPQWVGFCNLQAIINPRRVRGFSPRVRGLSPPLVYFWRWCSWSWRPYEAKSYLNVGRTRLGTFIIGLPNTNNMLQVLWRKNVAKITLNLTEKLHCLEIWVRNTNAKNCYSLSTVQYPVVKIGLRYNLH